MTKSPIIFGRINKRLLIPVFLSITQIIHLIVNNFYFPEKKDIVSSTYSLAIGQIIIKFLPCILKITKDDEIKKAKEIKQRKCLNYFFLCGLFLLDQGIHSAYTITSNKLVGSKISYNESNLFLVQDFAILSIEMAFMAIFSRFLLKYKYFKHHIISIIIFIVLGIACEIIIILSDNKGIEETRGKIKGYLIVNSIQIINTLVDALYFCYQKYLMETLYYPYWNIAFIPGIFIFALATTLLTIALIDKRQTSSSLDFVRNFYSYYRELNGWIIFGKIILVVVINMILCPLTILIIYYYSPNFILIIFQISTIVYSLIQNPKGSAYCIPLYAVQFLALMIHLEILELNFCGLNKYTKRNIELRGLLDSIDEGRDSSVGLDKIDINKDYFIEGNQKEEKTIEMLEKTDNIQENPNILPIN